MNRGSLAWAIAGLCLTVLAGCSANPTALRKAIAAYLAGDGAKAFPIFEQYAAKGDPDALFYLGRAYYEGNGAPVDNVRAAEAFVKASQGDKGDDSWIAAPVWAGLAYERLGDWGDAAAMHHMALKRYPHITSMLSLAHFIRQNLVSDANPIAAVRYLASAQAVMDQTVKAGSAKAAAEPDYLAAFSCSELKQAAFVEEKSQNPASPLAFSDLSGDARACVLSGDPSKLRGRLVSAAAKRLKDRRNGQLDEAATVFTFQSTSADQRRRYLPSPFMGYVAFASDADSTEAAASLSGHRFLNDHLGLPIASSVFPLAIEGQRWPYGGESQSKDVTSFYTGVDDLNRTPIDGVPEFFALARAWHEGRYDLFHSWYSQGQTLLYRSSALVRGGVTIPLGEFFAKVADDYRATGQILRLYFSAEPPEDTRLTFALRGGGSLAVNSTNIIFHQRAELDEGKQRYVITLRLPARSPEFVLDPEKAIAIDEIESLRIESPSCQAGCDLTLEKIENGLFDRSTAISEATLFRDLNIYPYGYSAHGGEGWALHGDLGMLNGFWPSLISDTADRGKTYLSPTFTMANVPQTKGYIEDLLSEIGVRAVRPLTLPAGRPEEGLAHDWKEPYKLFGLYRDKMNLAIAYFSGQPLQSAPLSEKLDFYRRELPNRDQLVSEICTARNCDPAQNGMIAALADVSLLKARTASEPFSLVWYTHFGAGPIRPTPEEPFAVTARAAFEHLAESQYGLTPEGGQTGEPRVLVTAPSTALRSRKLRFAVEGDVIEIDKKGDKIHILGGVDPFAGGAFPAPTHANRDLANLTFSVDNIFDAAVDVDGQSLAMARRRAKPDGDAGEVSVVDDESATTMVFGASASGPLTQLSLSPDPAEPGGLRACAAPGQVVSLFNVTHLAFENPFYATQTTGDLELELLVRGHPQQAFGLNEPPLKRHIFTTTPANVGASDIGTTVHTIDLPRADGKQPKDVVVDLTTPARYLPGAKGSISDLNVDGVVERLCVSVRRPAAASVPAFGPIRFLSPTTTDGPKYPSGLLAGGEIKVSSASEPPPAALRFARPESNDVVSMSLDDGFYYGKLPAPGFYRVSLSRPSCASAPEVGLLIERDRLDLDFDIDGCDLKQSTSPR